MKNELYDRLESIRENRNEIETIESALFRDYYYWITEFRKDENEEDKMVHKSLADRSLKLYEKFCEYSQLAWDEYNKIHDEWLHSYTHNC
jgi:uncharacterized coiled-coil DUF342 family protein